RLGVDHHAAHAAGRAGGALALQRGARRPPAAGAAAGTLTAVGIRRGLVRPVLARRRRGLGGLRLRLVGRRPELDALGRAGAEIADAEIARGTRALRARAAVLAGLLDLLARQRGVGH